MNRRTFLLTSAAGLLGARSTLLAQSNPTKPRQSPDATFLTDVPEYPGNVLLRRPTDSSVVASVLMHRDARAILALGERGKPRQRRASPLQIKAHEPTEVLIDKLTRDRAYDYELIDLDSGKPLLDRIGSFHTARATDSTFTFTIQADSHLDDGCRTDIYTQTIANQFADAPDFTIDMGDTSMAGKHPSRESAVKQFLAQRYYFGLNGHSVPSFLVLGNHDGEQTKQRGTADADGLAVWSNRQRKRLFPNPVPDRFYTGNDQPHEHAGLLQNFYSFTWGDALLVVLDPYWTSTARRGSAAGWNMSLGKYQYDWLQRTMEVSSARHKLVFIHQLVGGLDDAGRGGAEAARCFEWGGEELDGRQTFVNQRPNWPMPIHALLVKHGVRAVFHGHDHFFADQRRDGIAYVLAPQCAHRNYRSTHADEYGYSQGTFHPNSGHLRVTVAPNAVVISYIGSVPKALSNPLRANGQCEHSMTLVA